MRAQIVLDMIAFDSNGVSSHSQKRKGRSLIECPEALHQQLEIRAAMRVYIYKYTCICIYRSVYVYVLMSICVYILRVFLWALDMGPFDSAGVCSMCPCFEYGI